MKNITTNIKPRFMFINICVVVFVVGLLSLRLIRKQPEPVGKKFVTQNTQPFSNQDNWSFDFGNIVVDKPRSYKHDYVLINTSQRNVKIASCVNRMPCCGDVECTPKVLKPGDQAKVTVRLRTSNVEFGAIQHSTSIETDDPEMSHLELRTKAMAFPHTWIESIDTATPRLLSGEKAERNFILVSTGNSEVPVLDLNRVELQSRLNAAWTGQTRPRYTKEEGLEVLERPFSVTLIGSESTGHKNDEVDCYIDNTLLYRQKIQWEVVSPVLASPATIMVFSSNALAQKKNWTILLISTDRIAFNITKVEVSNPSLRVSQATSGARERHVIIIGCKDVPALLKNKNALTFKIDHPKAKSTSISFLPIISNM